MLYSIIALALKLVPLATTLDTNSNQLQNIIIGGIIGAIPPLIVLGVTIWQQSKRDNRSYTRQIERERVAFEQQLKREQIAYARSIQDAKRECLRNAYKVILNAAQEYEATTHELDRVWQSETLETRNQRINASLAKALADVNQAMIEITLEDVGTDVEEIFRELRLAFTNYILAQDSNKQVSGTYSLEELTRDKNLVISKAKELTSAMQKHLKELDS